MTRMKTDGFCAAFRRHFADLIGDSILVAVSGGADSVALLCLMHDGAARLRCRVFAAHVHHHLRGADADSDAEYCAELCGRLGIPLTVEHLEPERPRGTSPEAWWRHERYRALEEVRRRQGCAAIATAHTGDDQAETVLLKLLRGAGPRGVAGIRRRSGTVIRPLLDVPRAALRDYLTGRGVGWREDLTNSDLAFPRARIRNEILPVLDRSFPGSSGQLAAFAATLGADDELLSALLREQGVWPEVAQPVPLALVARLPEPLRWRWTLELAARLPLAEPPSRQQLSQVESLLAGESPAAVDLGRRWVLRRRNGALHLCPPPIPPFASRPIEPASQTELPGGFVGRVGVPGQGEAAHRARLHSRVGVMRLAWRSVAAGERFGTRPRPVSRLLAAAGIPREWRRAWPVLVADDTMIWIPAVGVVQGWEGDGAEGVVAELEEPWRRRVR